MANEKLLVIAESAAELPELCGGYTHIFGFDTIRLESAVTCDVLNANAGTASVSHLAEIDDQNTTESTVKISASTQGSVSAKLGFTGYARIFERHTLFILTIQVFKSAAIGSNFRLKEGMLDLARRDKLEFKRRFGTYFVETVDFGGLLAFNYAFETKDVDIRRSISASISQAGTGSVSLSGALNEHRITTQKTSGLLALGGDPIATVSTELGPTLGGVQAWANSVQDVRPIQIWIRKYEDAFPGFPSLSGGIILSRLPDFRGDLLPPPQEPPLKPKEPQELVASPAGPTELFRAQRLQVYAPPAPLWGAWTVVASHTGPRGFGISATPIGDTLVRGEVKYFNSSNQETTESFFGEVTIQCGNSYANVSIRLQGVILGSSCWVDVQ